VLGAALLMQLSGLSMAMGAFLAGVLLSESTFRHQLEADIEPFRGLLLGLFFLGVGMSLDLGVVAAEWRTIAVYVACFMAAKAAATYALARARRADNREAWYRAVLLSEGGEFAFVLYAAAAAVGILDANLNATLTATVIVSMTLMPVGVLLLRRLLPATADSFEGIDTPSGLSGTVLIIGFGRFGQVVSQALLARGFDVATIDTDTEMIRAAGRFGFKVYYGDGTRLDVLHACGAHTARAIAVCVDNRETASRIAALVKAEFPHAKLLARAFDRGHAVDLVKAGVDVQVRETFESALAFGGATLRELGVSEQDAADTMADVRVRDATRFDLDLTSGDMLGGAHLMHTKPVPQPFSVPRTEAEPLNEGAAEVLAAASPKAQASD
jgi:glutathione-regulated potassium-efflux system protein KefB